MQDYAAGIVIAIDPVAVRLGPVSLRWYGVLIALGITAGLYLALREARRRGMDEDAVYSAALWAIVAGVLGARLFHVVDKLDYYLQNPYLLISLGQGGLAMWGGIFGGLLAVWLYSRRHGLPALRLADAATPGLLVGQMIGRIGSLVNGDSWGAPTNLPWGVVYTHPDAALPAMSQGIPTHPYPAYELLWCLLVLGLVWPWRNRLSVDGVLFAAYLLLYSAGRFFLTFVREEGAFLFGLQQAQVVAAATFLVVLPWLVWLLTGRPAAQPARQ